MSIDIPALDPEREFCLPIAHSFFPHQALNLRHSAVLLMLLIPDFEKQNYDV